MDDKWVVNGGMKEEVDEDWEEDEDEEVELSSWDDVCDELQRLSLKAESLRYELNDVKERIQIVISKIKEQV